MTDTTPSDTRIEFVAKPTFLTALPEEMGGEPKRCICCEGPHCFSMHLVAIDEAGEPLKDGWGNPLRDLGTAINDFVWRKRGGRLLNVSGEPPVHVPGDRPGYHGHLRVPGKRVRVTVEIIDD